MGEISLKEFEAVLARELKPIRDDIHEIKTTMFGPEGRTGVAADVTEALKLSKEHETILRGKDKTSGVIKKINHLWFVATTGAVGLFWKAWDFFSNNPPAGPPHH